MVSILPFKRTGQLVSEIEDFLDKVSEALMVAERTMLDYLDTGRADGLPERVEQIRAVEERADELRRSIANVMYVQMLMPDTRGDVLRLLGEVDSTLDECVHLVALLAMERPPLVAEFVEGCRSMVNEAARSMEAMLAGARAYFKDPSAIRDHVAKTNFHEKEATTLGLRAGKAIYDSEMPLEQKRHLGEWIMRVRRLASNASDVGDELAVLAVKRAT